MEDQDAVVSLNAAEGNTQKELDVRVRRRTLRDFHDKFCGCFTVLVIEKMYNLSLLSHS